MSSPAASPSAHRRAASSAPPAFDVSSYGTTLYLVRHGETDYNRDHVMQGRGVDTDLNATGRAQAEALAERLADVPFDAAYASPLRRTRQTLDILARPHASLDTHFLPDLEEMGWGVYEGTPKSPERDAAMKALKEGWRAGAFDTRPDGGESILDVQRRALRAVQHVLTHDAGRTVLVVTHGRYLRVLLASLLPGYGLTRMHAVEHSNTGVNVVEHRRDGFVARLLNCTDHLAD
jgi:probable phosphoglycerate mutase